MWLGFMVLLSAHHFLIYARQVADELEQECQTLERSQAACATETEACSATAG